jgi:tripeptide aminopeptidase
VRSADLHKVDAVIEEIRAAFTTAAEQAGGRTTFESNWIFQPYEIPPGAEVRRRLEEALRRAGLEPEPVITPGGSDANNLNTKGIPAVNIGIGAQNPHSSEEYILLEDLQKTAEIVQNLINMD